MAAVTHVPVGTTATLLAAHPESATADASHREWSARRYLAKNVTATTTVYVGGTDAVTTANGFAWEATDGALAFTLEPGESMYAIVASGSQTVHVLGTGR
jgi:hypothetical protein